MLYPTKYLLYANAYLCLNQPDLERVYYDSTRLYAEQLQKSTQAYLEDAEIIGALGIAYAGLGNTAKGTELGQKAVELTPAARDAIKWPVVTENLAHIYTLTGKYEEALKLLEDLLSKPGPLTTRLLEMDPRWVPLKNLPGFQKLLRAFPVN